MLSVVPATLDEAELIDQLERVEAMAIIKVGRHLLKVKRILTSLDLMDKAHYIERATFDNQRTLALTEVTEDRAPYFSMILVHRRGVAWR